MRTSRYFVSTIKEAPAEAELASHRLMLRAGLIRRLGSGLYTWMPLGLRVLRKVEAVVREEGGVLAGDLPVPIEPFARGVGAGDHRHEHQVVGVKAHERQLLHHDQRPDVVEGVGDIRKEVVVTVER